MELTVSLRTRKPCELEQDGMHTDLLASQAQFLPLIVILKVPIINWEAIPMWQDAGTHRPGGGQSPAHLDDTNQLLVIPQVLVSPFEQKFWLHWFFCPVLYGTWTFLPLHKAAQVASLLSRMLIKEAHKGEISLLWGDIGGSWQAAKCPSARTVSAGSD